LETIKRADLAIRALVHAPRDLSLVVAGTGSQDTALATLAESLGVAGRVRFLGAVDDATLVELYAGALAVVFPPYDEDYGYVTLEAFLARKPIVTTTDAGEPTEFVRDDVTGCVTPPDPAAIGDALARLAADRTRAARLGEAGYERARTITWAGVVERLVAAAG
jgi:glycosyltransferase involved in cell wall biosynthesis